LRAQHSLQRDRLERRQHDQLLAVGQGCHGGHDRVEGLTAGRDDRPRVHSCHAAPPARPPAGWGQYLQQRLEKYHTAGLRAADDLAAGGIAARVIDLYSVKPVDQATLAEVAAAGGGRLVIAEDHHPQGGLGAAVLEALAGTGLRLRVRQCAVAGLPGSGTPDELMDAAGIAASRIATAARELIRE
jgi:hypothetical protein